MKLTAVGKERIISTWNEQQKQDAKNKFAASTACDAAYEEGQKT